MCQFHIRLAGRGGRAFSFVAGLSYLTIDRTSLVRGGALGGEGVLIPCIVVAATPYTVASLRCRDGARRVFADQAHIERDWAGVFSCFFP